MTSTTQMTTRPPRPPQRRRHRHPVRDTGRRSRAAGAGEVPVPRNHGVDVGHAQRHHHPRLPRGWWRADPPACRSVIEADHPAVLVGGDHAPDARRAPAAGARRMPDERAGEHRLSARASTSRASPRASRATSTCSASSASTTRSGTATRASRSASRCPAMPMPRAWSGWSNRPSRARRCTTSSPTACQSASVRSDARRKPDHQRPLGAGYERTRAPAATTAGALSLRGGRRSGDLRQRFHGQNPAALSRTPMAGDPVGLGQDNTRSTTRAARAPIPTARARLPVRRTTRPATAMAPTMTSAAPRSVPRTAPTSPTATSDASTAGARYCKGVPEGIGQALGRHHDDEQDPQQPASHGQQQRGGEGGHDRARR